MTKTIDEIKHALHWNDKAFQLKEAEIKKKIDNLHTELKYLAHSHHYIQQHLAKQLSTEEINNSETNGTFNLPLPVYANGLREAQQNQGKETEEHQVIDLTESVQEKEQNETPFPPIIPYYLKHKNRRKVTYSPITENRQCNQCTTTFPDSTSLKIHERTHDNYMKHKKQRKVNYSPIRQRR